MATKSAFTGPSLSAAKPMKMRPTAAEMFSTVTGSASIYRSTREVLVR